MKHRIRSIFWLMALCILGINSFQAYWLYNTYQLASVQFVRTTNEALMAVVFQQMFDQAGVPWFRLNIKDEEAAKQGEPRPVRENRIIMMTRPGADTGISILRGANIERIIVRRQAPPLTGRDSAVAPVINLRRLAADYRAELRRRDTEADFILDTLDLAKPTDGYGAKIKAPATYALRSRAVPYTGFQPNSTMTVQAAFKPPTFLILRQMSGLLVASVLLLGLTTGCFVLMLNTILRQKKLADVKNDFINNMTHELKTPLATVSAAVEALQNFGALQDPQRAQAYLGISHKELQRLSDLVEKVLNIAVEERQELAIEPEPTHPAELVQELVAHHQLKVAKPVHFTVDIAPTDTVLVDRLHLRNVINNLIDNAIKYSGEQEATIRIRGQHDDKGWWLSVQDNGIGIPKNYQHNIFEQFFRVPTGNLHPVKGFGLGLYYVRQVIERHGGQVAVRSTPNIGSEFSLWLPTY